MQFYALVSFVEYCYNKIIINIVFPEVSMKDFTGFKRGVNLGGWLSQCDNNDYSEKHFSEFITEKDFDVIAGWGLDHVRLPFDYNVIMTDSGEFIETGFKYIDFCLDECRKRGLNVVLDLHKTAGFVFDNTECFDFFDSEPLQELFIKLWKEMTRRYGARENAVFELLNEVTDISVAEKWNAIIERTVGEIRAINRDIRVIIGGIHNDSIYGLTLLKKPPFENMVFTVHCYSPLIFTHQKAYWVPEMPADYTIAYPETERAFFEKSHAMFGERYDSEFIADSDKPVSADYFERMFAEACRIAEENDVPLYCGEYGVIDKADLESTVRWFADIHAALDKMNIARAAWTYRQKDFGITDEHYSDVLEQIVKYL